MFVVFCSTDLAQEIRHPIHTNVHTPEGSQTLINLFDWSSLQNDSVDSSFDLKKVVLRLYKDGDFTKECAEATLNATVSCKHAGGRSQLPRVTQKVNMSNGRYWEQIDLTEQFKKLWPIPKGGKEVHVTVTLKSQCENNKLPIKLYNLKSISKLKLRRKLYSNQPVLSLYLNNDVIEKIARDPGNSQSTTNEEVLLVETDSGKQRSKRHDLTDKCRKIDHVVSFRELEIDYVILPVEYNAGRCVGSCNNPFVSQTDKREQDYKLNNYVKLMAAQAHVKKQPELAACCNPGKYDPLMLLIATKDGSSISQKLFNDMRVRECYCR